MWESLSQNHPFIAPTNGWIVLLEALQTFGNGFCHKVRVQY